jgi:hypothetical protein
VSSGAEAGEFRKRDRRVQKKRQVSSGDETGEFSR